MFIYSLLNYIKESLIDQRGFVEEYTNMKERDNQRDKDQFVVFIVSIIHYTVMAGTLSLLVLLVCTGATYNENWFNSNRLMFVANFVWIIPISI